MRKRSIGKTIAVLVDAVLVVSAIAIALPTTAQAQATRTDPYAKETLLKVVRLNALPTAEIIAAIQRRGVEFEMTPEIENEFKRAGARSEVMVVIRENYRPEAAPIAHPSTSSVALLTKDEIIRRLKERTPSATIEKDVEVRGVAFQVTPTISAEIKTSGGSYSLIGAISSNFRAAPAVAAPLSLAEVRTILTAKTASAVFEQSIEQRGVNFTLDATTSQQLKALGATNSLLGAISSNYRVNSPSAAPPVLSYDGLIGEAETELEAKNLSASLDSLRRAIDLDDSRSTAYTLAGDIYLAQEKYDLARDAMHKAIDRGGSASFRGMMHDHVGGSMSWLKAPVIGGRAAVMFQPGQYCRGTLFITKAEVTFKADDAVHSFLAQTSDIKQADMNSFHGTSDGAFNINVRDQRNNNFAPEMRSKQVSVLIVELIDEYHVNVRKAAEQRLKEEENRRKEEEKRRTAEGKTRKNP
jgi:hypothetical protein